jgi:hypothetical protein
MKVRGSCQFLQHRSPSAAVSLGRSYDQGRKTNTYAKQKTSLQRTLDILWIVHNFIRKHFTTQQVPAVALGILDQGLSWEQVLHFRKSAGTCILAA